MMSYCSNKQRWMEREMLRAQRIESEQRRALEPYAADADVRTPREVLSSLAGQSTYRTPDGGHGGGARAVLPYCAELTWALKYAKDPAGRALAAAIAMPDVARIDEIRTLCSPVIADTIYARGARYGASDKARLTGVLHDVLTDMIRPGTRKQASVRMRREDYLRLHRDMHACLDALAMTAEREAVDAMRAG